MGNCTFCDMYANNYGIIYEDKHFFARFDRYPVSPGHLEIISIRHVDSLTDLSADEWVDFGGTLKNVLGVIDKTDLRKLYESFIESPLISWKEAPGFSKKKILELNNKDIEFSRKMLSHIGIDKPNGRL